ncbi:MAG: hypothetical protein Q9175_006439 [Cornicularia normoerica]
MEAATEEQMMQEAEDGARKLPAGDPVIINNNIYIDSNDYLHPLSALNSQRNRNPAPPAIGIRRNTQRASGIRNVQHFGDPPNGGTAPQRRRHVGPPAPPPRASTVAQPEASGFWNVEDWTRGVASGQVPRSAPRWRTGSPLGWKEIPPTGQAEGTSMRHRSLNVPGAFPEDDGVAERFQLLTAPARVHAPGAPVHGNNGFWVRDARENRWRRQEKEDRRKCTLQSNLSEVEPMVLSRKTDLASEREDKRERQERKERRQRDRHEWEERRERDMLEREDRRERQEREERRERQEREERRERQDEMR